MQWTISESLLPWVTEGKWVTGNMLANGVGNQVSTPHPSVLSPPRLKWLMLCLHRHEGPVIFSKVPNSKRGSMWEPISPLCFVTKITNDSVHFIRLACLAPPLDTHWLFQCELASCVLCCCLVWPHRLVHLFWYLLSSLWGSRPHQCIWTWIWRLDSLWWVFFVSSTSREKVCLTWMTTIN